MSYFEFNKQELKFQKVSFFEILQWILVISITSGLLSGFFIYTNYQKIYTTIECKPIIIKESKDSFNTIEFKQYLDDINIKFPKIVYAQAILETNNFTSSVFKTNNNLFGIRQSTQRASTQKDVIGDYAFYNTWKESVLDYALFSATYLSKIETEDEYFQYLSQHYAEDKNYVSKLKQVIAQI